jgi:formate-dependent phosphoribosylglycinamide formyltransferase (GAR transformylase)
VSGKTLLILSGRPEAAIIAQRAKALGHTVVISDSDPQAPGFGFADSCLIADVQGAPETAAAAERYSRKIRRIDGVVCLADAPLTFATVAQRLRLPGPPLHVAELLADRLAMRRSFQSAGVATPWFAEISTPQELQRAVIARGRDLTIKPVENRGEEGAARLTQADDFAAAFLAARAASPSERVMVEQQGDAMPAAGLMQAGLCQSDAAKDIGAALGRAAAALGMMDGPVAAEIVQQGGQILVGDVSPRLALSGALLDAAIRQAFGE